MGVNLEDIEAIFDRYRVLDYFERKSERGLSFQGELITTVNAAPAASPLLLPVTTNA